MSFDCMTPDEFALWETGNDEHRRLAGYAVTEPCVDCPLDFRRQELAAGRCCKTIALANPISDELRARKREWQRQYRARQRASA